MREEVLHRGDGAEAAFMRARDLLRSFRFYEPIVQAPLPEGGLAVGATLDQRIRFGPISVRGPVRITEVADGRTPQGRRSAFAYEALPGHAERGTASFMVTLTGQAVRFRIESWSAHARWYVRLAGPLASFIQRRAVATAFRRMHQACQP